MMVDQIRQLNKLRYAFVASIYIILPHLVHEFCFYVCNDHGFVFDVCNDVCCCCAIDIEHTVFRQLVDI